MSRRGAPVPDRKEFFGPNAGAAKFPSVPPADEPRSARALRRRRAADAAQAPLSPARSASPPAEASAGAMPKASPAKGDRPREPVAPSTAVPAPQSKIIKVKPWEDKNIRLPVPKAPKSVGWQTVSHSKKRHQVVVASSESESDGRGGAAVLPKGSGSEGEAVDSGSVAHVKSAQTKKRKTANSKTAARAKKRDAVVLPEGLVSEDESNASEAGQTVHHESLASVKKRKSTSRKASSKSPAPAKKRKATAPAQTDEPLVRHDPRPRVLWKRDHPAGKASAPSKVKVSRAVYDAATQADRLTMQVVSSSSEASSGDEELQSHHQTGAHPPPA